MPKRLIAILLLCLASSLLAQTPTDCQGGLTGIVLDIETQQPIPLATIRVEGSELLGTTSDLDGKFFLKHLCDKEYNLIISHLGYKTIVHHHDPYHEEPIILLAVDDQVLESIVVEGEGYEHGTETITTSSLDIDDLSQIQGQSLGEVVSNISGVSFLSTGQNVVKPIIHGLHSNRVLIVNNGVRHEFQNWGVEHAPEIDPSLAGSIEVLKGAATVRYGPDALGGVILIKGRNLELSEGFSGAAGSFFNTNGRSYGGNVTLSNGWNNLAVRGQASWTDQGDLRAPDYNLTNTGKDELSYSGAFRFHKNRFDLEGYYSHFQQKLGLLTASVNGNLDDLLNSIESPIPPDTGPLSREINSPRQEVSHDLIKLKSTYVLDNQDFTLQYSFQRNDRQEFDIRRGALNDIPSIDLLLTTHTLSFDWSHPNVGPFAGQVGAQFAVKDNTNIFGTSTLQFIPNYNSAEFGLYAAESIELNNVQYEAGIRFDYQFLSAIGRDGFNDLFSNELTYSQATASLGLIKRIGNANFRSNLGLGWRPPNVAELYSFGRHDAFFEFGLWRYVIDENNALNTNDVLTEAERSVPSEVGWKWINTLDWQKGGLQGEVTAYINWIDNYIYTRPGGVTLNVRGTFPLFIYDQADALFTGLDIAAKKQVSPDIRLKWTGSYIWARQLENNSPFIGLPPIKLTQDLVYTRKPSFLSSSELKLAVSYTFKQFDAPRVVTLRQIIEEDVNDSDLFSGDQESDFDFLPAPEGFFLINLSWKANIRQWEWKVELKNVLIERYRPYTDRFRYFAESTGTNLKISAKYTFK